MKLIEVGRLYNLPDAHPGFQKPAYLFLQKGH
jgi:hypothetical protein